MANCNRDILNLDETSKAQFACSLASLILFDEKSDVTAEKITAILKAAKIDIPAYWPLLMAKNIEGKSLESFSGAAAGPAAAAPAKAEEKKDDKKAAKKEEKKPEPEEDMDLGGMFD